VQKEPSTRSPVVSNERMTPGHWSGLVLCARFSAFTLMVEYTTFRRYHPVPLILRGSVPKQAKKEDPRRTS